MAKATTFRERQLFVVDDEHEGHLRVLEINPGETGVVFLVAHSDQSPAHSLGVSVSHADFLALMERLRKYEDSLRAKK